LAFLSVRGPSPKADLTLFEAFLPPGRMQEPAPWQKQRCQPDQSAPTAPADESGGWYTTQSAFAGR
jgi:hypothetical protein